MKLRFNINGTKYDAEISKEDVGKVKIKVQDKEFFFEDERKQEDVRIAKTVLPKRNFKKKEITAPITGEVSEVFIKQGDFVKKEKKVVLLSAMKMENEIVSEFEGKVKSVLVKKSQKVNKGDILAILE